jgi:hypothetical protein
VHSGRWQRSERDRAATGLALNALAAAALALGLVGAIAPTALAGAAQPPGPHAAQTPVPQSLPGGAPAVPTVGAYLGVDPNFSPGEAPTSQASQLEADIHHSLGIVSLYTGFTSTPLISEMKAVAASGAIPMINVHCGAPDYQVADGDYNSQLRSQAIAYRDYGGPVLLRWFWEMNLDEVPGHAACLGSAGTAAADYVAAFRQIETVFVEAGATNVSFVWAPSDAEDSPLPDAYYPGDQYVGWIGADMYDRPGYRPWSTMFADFYAKWSTRGKPLILSETGAVTSPSQVAWLSDIGTSAPSQFPDLHAVVYVDADDLSSYVLVPGTPGMAEFAALAADPYFTPTEVEDGYLLVNRPGDVTNYGCNSYGSVAGQKLPAPVVGLAEQPAQSGYWLTGSDGSVYPFGTAKSYGSMRGRHLNQPIVGIAPTADGRGYWLVATDGGIFSFGDARFYGSMGGEHLNKPIVGIAVAWDGKGYWLVASDGGIFSFGDARFRGSTGGEVLNKPIVGMSPTHDGDGYWLVASDGGVFAFGDAHFHGALPSLVHGATVVGIATDPRTGNYRLATIGGYVYQFPSDVQLAPTTPPPPVVGIVTVN